MSDAEGILSLMPLSPGRTAVTPVNAANLETMEADTAAALAAAAAADAKASNAQTTANAAQPKTEKGQVNGYASLDAGGTVPDAQLPAALARDAEVTSATQRACCRGRPAHRLPEVRRRRGRRPATRAWTAAGLRPGRAASRRARTGHRGDGCDLGPCCSG